MSTKTTILINGSPMEVDVIELQRERAVFAIKGRTFTVEMEQSVPQEAGAAPSARRTATSSRSRVQLQAGEAAIHAPIPGLLIELLVAEGDTVQEGAIVAKLEAMKMQNSIIAPVSGVVARLGAATGDEISDGQLLVVIKTAE